MNRVNTKVGADLADPGQLCTRLPSLSARLHTQISGLAPLPSPTRARSPTHVYLKESEHQYEPSKTVLQAIGIEEEAFPIILSTHFSFLAYLAR